MKLLAIETSCDETAIAILECTEKQGKSTFTVLGDALYSQAAKHAQYGGVYPSLAKREHAKNSIPLLTTALTKSGMFETQHATEVPEKTAAFFQELFTHEEGLAERMSKYIAHTKKPEIDAIAVTIGPGLEPALWVGVNVARALSRAWKLPIIAVNHLEGHLVASAVTEQKTEKGESMYELRDVKFPILGLLISGGHSQFVTSSTWGSYTLVGNTRDDSVGEAFDKVARMLGLPYPGGPAISELAEKNRAEEARPKLPRTLPRPMQQSKDLDLSFSGLKTSVRYLLHEMGDNLSDIDTRRVARAFEDAVTDVLVSKSVQALKLHRAQSFLLGGGVSANTYIAAQLRAAFTREAPQCTLYIPKPPLHTDNAIMIGMAGFLSHSRGAATYTDASLPPANGRLRLRGEGM